MVGLCVRALAKVIKELNTTMFTKKTQATSELSFPRTGKHSPVEGKDSQKLQL